MDCHPYNIYIYANINKNRLPQTSIILGPCCQLEESAEGLPYEHFASILGGYR